ncbi:MAG TPA: hypothetical protein ENK86_00035 [Campylobacterales bacterium]|nr:hypothetical protein [Campylobacterales bacterium]
MAKKKKKQSLKINNKIRELLNGEPFDEGIQYLDEEILVELSILLNLRVSMLVKKEMIRSLRQVWSEGDNQARLLIINYLEQLGVRSAKTTHHDKVNHIVSLLSHHQHSKEEEQEILAGFVEMKLSKITPQKIANRLSYIRQQEQIHQLETRLNVTFNTLNKLEFYHSYTFDVGEEIFTKSLLTLTEPIDTQLLQKDQATIVAELTQHKEEAIAHKEQEIETFLMLMFNKGHTYLKSH